MGNLFKTARCEEWQAKIKVAPYKQRTARFCTDKRVSESWKLLLQAAVDRRNADEPIDREAIDKLPRRLLESFKLVLKAATERRAGYEKHVDEYSDELASAGRSAMYVYNVRKYLKLTATDCGWKTLGDVNRDKLKQHLETKLSNGTSCRTLNNILSIHKAFFVWCNQLQRMDINPCDTIKRFDATATRRRIRRAAKPDEVARLLAIAGPRELVYRVALATGLRRLELRRLQWRDVQLGNNRPCLTLRAEATKSKRGDVLPLTSDIALRLQFARPADANPHDIVFRYVPSHDTWLADVKRAGLDYKAADGTILGFHSLRATFISELQRAGLSPQVVMQLARHTDYRLTNSSYTDKRFIDVFAGVEVLPNYPVTPEMAVAIRTGTDNQTVSKARETDQMDSATKCATKKCSDALSVLPELASQTAMVGIHAGISEMTQSAIGYGKNAVFSQGSDFDDDMLVTAGETPRV